MSSKTDSLPFELGKTYYGGNAQLAIDIANSTLKGAELLGVTFEKEDVDEGDTTTPFVKPYRSYCRRRLMAVRNLSGITLHRKRLVRLKVSGLSVVGTLDGYATNVDEPHAYPLDEFLSPTIGLPNGDIGYIVVYGPAMCLTDLAGGVLNVIADGDVLGALTGSTTGATTSGRVYTVNTAASSNTGNALLNSIGWAMSAKTTGQSNGDVLVFIRQH